MKSIKRNILIYLDNYPMLVALPPDQRGWILTALMVYGDRLAREEAVTPEDIMDQFVQLSPEARLVFGFMASNILRDTQKWLSRQRGQSRPAPRKGAPPAPDGEQRIREDMERARQALEQSRQ